jgi:DNA-binding transcriptional regulator YiaG
MICDRCSRRLRRGIREKYPYTDGGLTNVFLRNVPVYVCPRHGVQAVVLRGIDRILGDIKRHLLNRGAPFTQAEVRFLRKYEGWTQDELADRLGVHKITVAKWETGRVTIGPTHQRLLYLLFKDPSEFRKAEPRVRRAKTRPILVPAVRPGKPHAAPAARRVAAAA